MVVRKVMSSIPATVIVHVHVSCMHTDILLVPLESRPKLQNAVSQLCEAWWCGGREDRDGLVPHMLLYLVARSLTEGALVSG